MYFVEKQLSLAHGIIWLQVSKAINKLDSYFKSKNILRFSEGYFYFKFF